MEILSELESGEVRCESVQPRQAIPLTPTVAICTRPAQDCALS